MCLGELWVALGGSAGEPPRKRTRSHVEETGGPIEELFIACNEPCFNVRVSFNSCNPGFINNKTTRIRLGFTTLHDSRRYAIPLSMPALDPSHPDRKARCAAMMNTPP
jgi:hypothetical protein